MKHRILAILLCLCMILALAACGGSAVSTPASSTKEASTPEAEASAPAPEDEEEIEIDSEVEPASAADSAEEESPEEEVIEVSYPLVDAPYSFTCWTTYGPGMDAYLSMIDQFPAFEKAEEVTGVSIEFIPCDQATQPEKLNLYVASGTMPDVMLSMASLYSTGGEGMIEDEVAYDLNEYMDLMPYYQKYLSVLDQETLDNLYTNSGYLPAIMSLGSQENVGLNIRQDWLDALGLEIPKTYDELENVLLAFQSAYGCRNTLYMLQDFGFTTDSLANGYDTQVNAAMNGLHFYQIDGKVYSGDFNEGARDYLQMLADWYAEGIFSDDCITLKNVNDNPELIYKDGCGVWVSEAEFLTDTYAANAQDPNFKAAPMADVGKTADQTLHLYAIGRNWEGQSGWSVTTCCDSPDVVCQYIDWFFSPEGTLAANWGTEGVSYELDADGNPYYTDLILHSTEFPTAKIALTMYTGTPVPCGQSLESTYALTDPVVPAAGEVYRSNQDGAYICQFSLNGEEMMEFFTICSDILTKKAEVVAQIVMGEADMSAFDSLEEYANEVGLIRATEIIQTAYDRDHG